MPAPAAWSGTPVLPPPPAQPAAAGGWAAASWSATSFAAVGVLRRGGSDDQGQQQSEGVGRNVLLSAFRPFPRVVSLRGLRGAGGGLHHPRVGDRRGRLR